MPHPFPMAGGPPHGRGWKLYRRHRCQVACDIFVAERVVGKVAIDEAVVRRHVNESMTRKVEQNDRRLVFFIGLLDFTNDRGDGMATLGSGDDALCLGKEHSGREGL